MHLHVMSQANEQSAGTQTEQAWDVHKDRLEFSGVFFQQFKERLRDHRKQVKNNPGPSGSK